MVISSSCLHAAYSGDMLLSTVNIAGDSSPVIGSQLNSSFTSGRYEYYGLYDGSAPWRQGREPAWTPSRGFYSSAFNTTPVRLSGDSYKSNTQYVLNWDGRGATCDQNGDRLVVRIELHRVATPHPHTKWDLGTFLPVQVTNTATYTG